MQELFVNHSTISPLSYSSNFFVISIFTTSLSPVTFFAQSSICRRCGICISAFKFCKRRTARIHHILELAFRETLNLVEIHLIQGAISTSTLPLSIPSSPNHCAENGSALVTLSPDSGMHLTVKPAKNFKKLCAWSFPACPGSCGSLVKTLLCFALSVMQVCFIISRTSAELSLLLITSAMI